MRSPLSLDQGLGGPLGTPDRDLRIRRLGVRIPPGAPAFCLVRAFFSRSANIRVRCRRALRAVWESVMPELGWALELVHDDPGPALVR
jgi:hypothetical protein